jgi:hypothetical protein
VLPLVLKRASERFQGFVKDFIEGFKSHLCSLPQVVNGYAKCSMFKQWGMKRTTDKCHNMDEP